MHNESVTIKKTKTTQRQITSFSIYRLAHLLSVIYGALTLFVSLFGIVIFFYDNSFRINQLMSMIIGTIASISLLIPIYKTNDEKRLTKICYLITATTALTTGLLTYPIYVISFALLLVKLFIVSLRLFTMLKSKKNRVKIRKVILINLVLLITFTLLSTQGMRWLVQTYGKKIIKQDVANNITLERKIDPTALLPDLGFTIPGKPIEIWEITSAPQITLINTLLPGKGGEYSTLFIHDGNTLTKLTQVNGIEFSEGNYSIGEFGTPTISPDQKYLFIPENGYEGGRIHAFNIQTSKPLAVNSYPSSSGVMHWSPGGKCIMAEMYEYGDRQVLQLGAENGNGYVMYPYEKSVTVAMGISNLSIFWLAEPKCAALLTFTAGMMIHPKEIGENIDQEIIFNMEEGPVKRSRWQPLPDFEISADPAPILQIYP